jgi:NTE family protein
MNTSSAPTRALVLGGGGSTGNAWLVGAVAGLLEGGVDVTDADLIVGTSAGSTAAVQITTADPADVYTATLAPVPPRQTGPGRPVSDQLDRLLAIIAGSADVVEMRRRLGAAALERDAEADGTWQPQWRSTVAARLPSQDWPDQLIRLTVLEADTGEPAAFDRDSGVPLADAVAASCSNGLPFWIDGRPYLDGGFRANAENADVASGYDRVLVLSPFGGRSLHPEEWGTHLAAQVDALRADGSVVEVIGPDSEELFGTNAMDVSLRPAAAQAGHADGKAAAVRVAELWG